MEKILMSASSISAIVLILVAIIKTPIIRYKEKKWYKPVLTLITFAIIFGCCVLCELFIRELPLFCLEFLWLILGTVAGVMFSYNGVYEGLGLKDAKNKLFTHLKELKKLSPEAKAVKAVEKVQDTLITLYNTTNKLLIAQWLLLDKK